jgi:hypothetical protein
MAQAPVLPLPSQPRFPQLALPGALGDGLGPLRYAVILEALLAAPYTAETAAMIQDVLAPQLGAEDVAGVPMNAEALRRVVATMPDLARRSSSVLAACRRMRTAAREACAFQTHADVVRQYTAEQKYRAEEKKYRAEEKKDEPLNWKVPTQENVPQRRFDAYQNSTGSWVHGTLDGTPVITGVRRGEFNYYDNSLSNKFKNGITGSIWANMATHDMVLGSRIPVPEGTADTVAGRMAVAGRTRAIHDKDSFKHVFAVWASLDEDDLNEIPVPIVMQVLLTSRSRVTNQIMRHERGLGDLTWGHDMKLYPDIDRWLPMDAVPLSCDDKKDFKYPGTLVLAESVELSLEGVELARFIRSAALALFRLHGQRFCHNNVVPWSFALTKGTQDPSVVLCDLAFIRPLTLHAVAPQNPPVFEDESRIPVPGASSFCAPESFHGVFNTRSDVYMLGRTIHALATGVFPVRGAPLDPTVLEGVVGRGPLVNWVMESQRANPADRPTLVHLLLVIGADPPRALIGKTASSMGERMEILKGRALKRPSLGSLFYRPPPPDAEEEKKGKPAKSKKNKAGKEPDVEPAKKKSAKEKPAKEKPAKEKSAKKKSAEEKPAKEKPAKKKPDEEKLEENRAKRPRPDPVPKRQDGPVFSLLGDNPGLDYVEGGGFGLDLSVFGDMSVPSMPAPGQLGLSPLLQGQHQGPPPNEPVYFPIEPVDLPIEPVVLPIEPLVLPIEPAALPSAPAVLPSAPVRPRGKPLEYLDESRRAAEAQRAAEAAAAAAAAASVNTGPADLDALPGGFGDGI